MKKFFLTIFLISALTSNLFAASSSSGSSTKSNYDQAVKLIKSAKSYEKKGKLDKATKRYEKAFKLLIKSNKKKPSQPDTLNYLGFTSRKIGNYEVAEKYYLEGLALDPNHNGINEYLGELYVKTNRIEKAKERLEVLKNCNCEEFQELNNVINSGISKY
jgi:tetratricopeptide (TPR) repeat protein|tara:strand:+ start:111 stop:590 length:480 start_codon:yes stop_codon:yes gene_type:complete